ncbi:TPA: glycosyltransferase [archaeon]|uniref:Glycosyltransferase n=1 Tax=Candidatus Naiadarchaeum limnaeum TaxID=2756139 RepID=A0A832XM34_9ARCH|nr:glycosyltransferase [Candidatus Naiadarchaeales archaeon SRR2090153.bin1042]HIK00683.1 glycosyltransferase [Candidatus Naiadarchaeum limnaeum]
MKKPKHFSIIIPAHNEERRIKRTLERFYKFFSKKYKIEIIVVCDGNSDKTESIVQEFAAKRKNIKLLTFPTRLGKGGGILKGIKAARGDIIGYVDADSATRPQDYNKIFQTLITKNLDGAVASRYLKESKILIEQPLYRIFLSRGWNLIVHTLFQIPFTDTQCGAKIFTAKALEFVVPKMETYGFEFDVELLWRMQRSGFRINEVPITWEHKEQSKFVVSDIIGMLIRLIRVRLS